MEGGREEGGEKGKRRKRSREEEEEGVSQQRLVTLTDLTTLRFLALREAKSRLNTFLLGVVPSSVWKFPGGGFSSTYV